MPRQLSPAGIASGCYPRKLADKRRDSKQHHVISSHPTLLIGQISHSSEPTLRIDLWTSMVTKGLPACYACYSTSCIWSGKRPKPETTRSRQERSRKESVCPTETFQSNSSNSSYSPYIHRGHGYSRVQDHQVQMPVLDLQLFLRQLFWWCWRISQRILRSIRSGFKPSVISLANGTPFYREF